MAVLLDVLTRCQENSSRTYSLGFGTANFNVQNSNAYYLCGCVKVVDIAKRYTEKGSASRRSHTCNINNGDVSVRVCMVAFLKIFGSIEWASEQSIKSSECKFHAV